LLNIIESQRSLNFCIENKGLPPIIWEITKYCEGLAVFGSYSSGRFNNQSDLDLVVLGKHDRQQIKKIKQKQIIEINEHYSTYGELKKLLASKNALAAEIKNNHLLFGDISKIIETFIGG
jgi:predicted nucleotidyltransferase